MTEGETDRVIAKRPGMGIMVGPPDAVPPNEPNWDWHQFGDGMYYWITWSR